MSFGITASDPESRNFRPRLQRFAAAMPYGATDSTAPRLGGGAPGKMGQTIRERFNRTGRGR